MYTGIINVSAKARMLARVRRKEDVKIYYQSQIKIDLYGYFSTKK